MLVTGMTGDEIFQEIKADFPNVLQLSDVKVTKVNKIIQKSVLFPIHVHSFVTTKRKNNWIILWEAKSKKHTGDKSLLTLICWQDTSIGKYVFMPSLDDNDMSLVIYPPHFFSRYAERTGLNLTGIDLIRQFFEKNANYGFDLKYEDSDGHPCYNIYGSCKEGVAMGLAVPEKKLYLLKTFITYDMLKGEQIELFCENERIRREINESEFII